MHSAFLLLITHYALVSLALASHDGEGKRGRRGAGAKSIAADKVSSSVWIGQGKVTKHPTSSPTLSSCPAIAFVSMVYYFILVLN